MALNIALLGAETTVLPPGSAEFEDDHFSGVLAYPVHIQEVYHASLLPQEPLLIRSMWFRRDRLVSPVGEVMTELQVRLSTTERQPDELDLDMSLNPGADETLVFEGALSFDSTGTGPAEGPNPFDIEIPFATPFQYDPAAGNLLVDLQTIGGTGALYVDAADQPDDMTSRVFVILAGQDALTRSDSETDVIELHYDRVLSVPIIELSPEDAAVPEGGDAEFSVTAAGANPLFYQWYWNDEVLDLATNRWLSLSNVTTALEGEYRVQVSNALGSTPSEPARLTVLSSPWITTQPHSRTAGLGANVQFSVVASGSPPLVLGSVEQAQAGSYTVRVSNAEGSVTSEPAVLVLTSNEWSLHSGWDAAGFTLTVAGAVEGSYAVEWSSDLESWTLLATVQNAPAMWQVHDPDSVGQARRFYRVSLR